MILSHAYIINLDHRKDRLASITEQCEKNNLKMHRIPAVNGNEKYFDVEKRKRGFFACYDSHKKVLEMLLDVEGNYFLVAEDDCIFADNFRVKLSKYYEQLPTTWELLYLGGSAVVDGATEPFSYNLMRAKHIFCTHCYVIKKTAIPELIKTLETRQWKVDVLFCEFQKEHNCFITTPELAWQMAGLSDVENKITDNVHLRINS